MPGKKVPCSYCSKVMRSDNLKNHIKIHERAPKARVTPDLTTPKRDKEGVKDNHREDEKEKISQNVIHRDKQQLLNLLEEFASVVEEEDVNKLVELEKLVNGFLIMDGYEMSETLPKIHNKLDQLVNSRTIPRYELAKMKILVNNISKKRYIIRELFKNDNIDKAWKSLWGYGLISFEDYNKFTTLNQPNIEDIIDILREEYHIN